LPGPLELLLELVSVLLLVSVLPVTLVSLPFLS
jgi:hypothetical protein